MPGGVAETGSESKPEDAPLFGIARSASGRRWRIRPHDANVAARLAASAEMPALIARLIAARGVTPDGLPSFLEPSLRESLVDPSTLVAMDAAAARIADAIIGGEGIGILADYDVDGATSAALLVRYLAALGVDAAVHVPDRVTEGYGPNAPALLALSARATLIICVDCGVAAHEAFAAHAEASPATDIVVFDHHQAGEDLPVCHALVNPNRLDDLSGQGALAACGVTFLGLVAISRVLRGRGVFEDREEPDLLALLGLVALGTVCDVVPLTGLNRAYVTQGLRMLRQRRDIGLGALGEIARLNEAPGVYHLGYVLGPRINAGGRVGQSDLGVRLLTSTDDDEALALAAELERHNLERQTIEAAATSAALAAAEAQAADARSTLTVAGEDWHPGVVGLVAARLKERFRCPAVAISIGEDGVGRGSARSVAGVDIGAAIRAAAGEGLLVKGGGHAMAAGLSIAPDRIAEFSDFLETHLGASVRSAEGADSLSIDAPLMAGAATDALMDWLEKIGPFGAGHPEPRFAFPAHTVGFAKPVGQGHVKTRLRSGDGKSLDAIAFRVAGTPLGDLLLGTDGLPLHIAGKLRRDRWGGRSRVQLIIDDAARVNQ